MFKNIICGYICVLIGICFGILLEAFLMAAKDEDNKDNEEEHKNG